MKFNGLSRFLLASFLLALVSSEVQAQRLFVGSRNLGMGNTGVASTTNGLAVHFNPAAMAFAKSWDLHVPLITLDAQIGLVVWEHPTKFFGQRAGARAKLQYRFTVQVTDFFRIPEQSRWGGSAGVGGG